VGQQRRSRAERGHRVRLDERLHDALVHRPQVDATAQVVQRCERSRLVARLASGDDGIDGALADVLDRREAETDPFRHPGDIGLHREEGR
jgi:hypothetical protein